MKTINGKLISEELQQLDELTQITSKITQRCESLESQVLVLSRQDYTQYFHKVNQEFLKLYSVVEQVQQDVNKSQVNLPKVHQELEHAKSIHYRLNKRVDLLEQTVLMQAKQLQFLKLSIIGFIIIWLIITITHQLQKPREAYKLASITPKTQTKAYAMGGNQSVDIHKIHKKN